MSLRKTTATLLLATAASLTLAAPAFAAPQTYKLDPTHTAITWHVNHFGFSTPSGKFMNTDGTVILDEKDPAASKVSVTIQVADVNSGVSKLDEHLRKEDFFDTAKYPTAKFVSDKVKLTGKDTADVTGMLTIRDISKPVTLKVKLNKLAENMFKKQTAGFSATTTIKRSDFGMDAYVPNLGDEVRIDIESEANLVVAGE